MSGESKGRKPCRTAKGGPVKPGSSLYRVLEMIAREVAKSMETMPCHDSKRLRRQ